MNARTLVLLSALSLGACSDHTEGVATATVSAPVAPTPIPAEAAPTPTTAPSAPARTTLTIDRAGSEVGFTGAKITDSHTGTFSDFSGTIELGATIPESRVSVAIQIASLVIEPARLHGHLLSPDLLDAAGFPTATFESTSITEGATGTVGDLPATHTVTGNLTLHGQTRSITFPAIIAMTDTEVTSSAEFVIDRMTFGIVYPGMPDDLIRPEVVVRFRVRAPRG